MARSGDVENTLGLMSTLALISGLVGALLSAVLSFVVRRALDAKAQRESERKLAYVFLVRVSGLLAAESVIRKVLTIYFKAIPETAELASAQYDTSHRLSAVVALMLTHEAKGIVEDPKYRAIPRMVQRILEDAKESRLSPDQLAKLPREVIYAFDRYQSEHSQMCQVAGMWSDYFEHDDRAWVTAEGLHDQWRSLARFIKEATELRAALVKFGAASQQEATLLSRDQEAKLHAALATKFADRPKLDAAGQGLPLVRTSNET